MILRSATVVALVAASLAFPTASAVAAPATVVSAGSFIQPGVTADWTYSDWLEELEYLDEAGNEFVILNWTAEAKTSETIYPTSMSGWTQDSRYTGDPVEDLLDAADSLGMDVQLGLASHDDWYTYRANDATWLDALFEASRDVASDLYTTYGSHPSFAGFYEPNEMENCNFQSPTQISRMADVLQENADHVHGLAGGLLYTFAPALWPEAWCSQNYATNFAAWEATWDGILSQADIDYLMVQDGLGAPFRSVPATVTWFQDMAGVVAGHPATELWADIETFDVVSSSPWYAQPMPIAEVVDHMKAIDPYVSGIVTFSYDHYQSPKIVMGKTDLYHETYLDYLATDTVETGAPSQPTGLTTTKTGPTATALTWSASTDDTGAMYYVERNGTTIGRTHTPTFQDHSLSPSTAYTYRVVAFDAAGNQSSPSSALVVTTPASAVDLSSGRSYSTSAAASGLYPDTGDDELTDGQRGSTSYSDSRFQGRWDDSTPSYSFTVDLGSTRRIDRISQSFLLSNAPGVSLPKKVDFAVSANGSTYTDLGPSQPSLWYGGITDPSVQTFGLITDGSVTGRYVRVSITTYDNDTWTMTDELLVEQYPVNLAAGRTYSASVAASASYPDTGGSELTNGTFGETLYTDAAWQGRANAGTYTVTVDLGSATDVSQFFAHHLVDTASSIVLPTSASVSTSLDNLTYTARGSLSGSASGNPGVAATSLTLGSAVSARYVRFSFTGTAWSFLSELRVIR